MPLSKIESASLETAITADSLGVTGNLTFTGTGNRIIGDFSNATLANAVIFQTSTTNGSTRLRVMPNGTGTDNALDLFGSTDLANSSRLSLRTSAADMALVSTREGTGTYLPMTFYTGGSERVRVDTSGNVNIGGSTNYGGILSVTRAQTSGIADLLTLRDASNGATFNLQTYADPTYGTANRFNYDGAYLAFRRAGTEQMRLDSSGNLLVGTTSNFSAKFSVLWANSTQSGITLRPTSETYNGSPILFQNSSGGVSGFIGQSTSSVSYNTSSDYRLKDTIAPMTGALAKVAALKPCTYKWKVDGSDGQGFIAHELAEVEAGCVTGEKDAVDAEGNPQYQGIDTSFLVATLAAAIQELKAIVDAQGAEIAALKGTP